MRARRTSWAALCPWTFGLLFGLGILASSAASASAQSFFDPTDAIQTQATGWVTQAAAWARHIYLFLLIFEIIALAVTALLFRENLGEFFAGVGFKVLIGGVFFWFIDNAGTDPGSWTHQIITSFRTIGLQFAGLSSDTPEGPSPFVWLGTEGVMAATAYITAGIAMQAQCAFLASGLGYLTPPAVGFAILDAGHFFEMAIQGMGVMILMGMGAIYLQLVLITIESYIVMGAGVLFIGFAGSRFTLPFSQGYFSYMMNVGVKYLVIYIVLAIEQPLMNTILGNAVGALVGSLIPGVGLVVVIIAAAFGLINVIIAAALVWMIPGLVGSLLSGQSSASGSAVLSQTLGAMAGAAQAMAQLQSGRQQDKSADAQSQSENGKTGDSKHSGAGTHASSSHHSPMSPASSQMNDPAPVADGSNTAASRSETPDDLRSRAAIARAYALSGLAQAAPRDIGQPSAVQVRLANPDKL